MPNQHTFTRRKNKVVIVEGIYLLHDSDGWDVMKRLFDWTIYIDADVDTCIERLKVSLIYLLSPFFVGAYSC